MARIELKYCTIRMRDGLNGTALVNQPVTPPAPGDTTLTVDTVALNIAHARASSHRRDVHDRGGNESADGAGRLFEQHLPLGAYRHRPHPGRRHRGSNAQQSVTLTTCTTTFTLTWNGNTTDPIAYNAAARRPCWRRWWGLVRRIGPWRAPPAALTPSRSSTPWATRRKP